MTKGSTVSRLESLLARIRQRAATPRGEQAASAVPSTVMNAPPQSHVAAVPRQGPSFQPPQAEAIEETTLPPAAPAGELDLTIDVEVPPATPPPAFAAVQGAASVHQPLPIAPESSRAEARSADAADVAPSIEQVEVAAEADADGFAGEEDESADEAPASSRRPVTPPPEERLAALAFGTDEPQPPRHTAPPKSGRLPSALSVDFDPDVTGVRSASPVAEPDEEQTVPLVPSVLKPQEVRPEVRAAGEVRAADVIGEAQRFSPSTFLALLDASLAL